jgi:hypothetical protein
MYAILAKVLPETTKTTKIGEPMPSLGPIIHFLPQIKEFEEFLCLCPCD